MEQKHLQSGDYIYSAAAIPECASRSFLVGQTDEFGNISAYPARPARGLLNPDELRMHFNHGNDVYVQLNTVVEMSSRWPALKQPRTLTPESLQEFQIGCHDTSPKAIIKADDPTHFEKDLWEQVQDLYLLFRQDPKVFLEYLEFSQRFYAYSARNQMMIYKQAPYSTFVTSRQRWADMGYSIRPEHILKDVKIMRPQERTFFNREGHWVSLGQATPKERELLAQNKLEQFTKTTFVQMSVYDISQTTCPIEEYPQIFDKGHLSSPHAQLFDAVKRVAELEGIPVMIEDVTSISMGGYYTPTANKIVISDKEQDTRKAIVMLHEYSHALLHNSSQPTLATEVKEFEAQTLAVKLMQHYGFEVDGNEKDYIVSYLKKAVELGDQFAMDKSLERINRQFAHASERISAQLEWINAQNPEQAMTMDHQAPTTNPQQSASIQENFLQGL